MGLPFAYWFGLIPALVMWLEDWFLEDKMQLWPKVLTSTIFGYAVSIAMIVIWTAVPIPLRQLLTFGIVGAVQGALCSWLSGIKPKQPALSPDCYRDPFNQHFLDGSRWSKGLR